VVLSSGRTSHSADDPHVLINEAYVRGKLEKFVADQERRTPRAHR
jgi:hypothetical protein